MVAGKWPNHAPTADVKQATPAPRRLRKHQTESGMTNAYGAGFELGPYERRIPAAMPTSRDCRDPQQERRLSSHPQTGLSSNRDRSMTRELSLPVNGEACGACELSGAPPIGGLGVLPEVLLAGVSALCGEVFLNDAEHRAIGRDEVADRPIAAVDQAVLAEHIPEFIQGWTVEVEADRHMVLRPAQHVRNLRIHLAMLPQFVQSLQVLRSLHQVGRGIIWQMIDDDPQAGHLVGNPHHLGQQRGASNDVNLQPGFCQKLQVCDELRLRQFGCEAPPPQVPDADTEKERILVEASEIASKTGLAWFEVSNRSDENRVLRRKVENPLVVFDERTRLHLDDAGDSERLRESDKLVGEDSPVQLCIILGQIGRGHV